MISEPTDPTKDPEATETPTPEAAAPQQDAASSDAPQQGGRQLEEVPADEPVAVEAASDAEETSASESEASESETPAAEAAASAEPEATADAGQSEGVEAQAAESAAEDDAAAAASGDDAEGDSAEATAEPEPAPEPEPDDETIARVRALFVGAAASLAVAADEDDETPTPTEDAPFRFARWTRAVAPRVYGVEPQSAETLTNGFKLAAEAAGVGFSVEDEAYGANVLLFVCSDWAELLSTPQLERLIPERDRLAAALHAAEANQYRIFGFDESGAIDLAVVLLRMDDAMSALSGEAVALAQAVQSLLLWSESAFGAENLIKVTESGRASLRPFAEALLAAAYEDGVPAASDDPELAVTLARSIVRRQASNGRDGGRGDNRRSNNRRRRRSGGGRKRRGESGAEA